MSSLAPFVLVGLALPLAACGGTETDAESTPSSATPVATAFDETFAADTARVTLTFEHTRDDRTLGHQAGDRQTLEGTADFARHRTEIESDGGDRMIVDETTFYVQPAAEGDLQWRKFDLDATSEGELAPDFSLGRLDVVRQLEYAASIAGSLELVGEEDRGAATTRYTGHGQADGLMRALLSEPVYGLLPWSSHAVTVDRSQPIPLDVWVGEDGRVHKISYDFPDFSSYFGDLTTVELHDFGADVDIELPDAVDG